MIADGGVAADLTPEELLRDPDALRAAGMTVPPLLAFLADAGAPVRATLAVLDALAQDVAVAA